MSNNDAVAMALYRKQLLFSTEIQTTHKLINQPAPLNSACGHILYSSKIFCHVDLFFVANSIPVTVSGDRASLV